MTENELTSIIIGAAIEVHSELGPGLFENVYEKCLQHELLKTGLFVESQKEIKVVYKGENIDVGFRIDLFVENKIIVEVKAVKELSDVHLAQTLTYLKLSDCKLGLLINFNVKLLKHGIKRVVNNL